MRQFYPTLSGIHAIEVTYLSAVQLTRPFLSAITNLLSEHQSSYFLNSASDEFFLRGVSSWRRFLHTPAGYAQPQQLLLGYFKCNPPRIYELLCTLFSNLSIHSSTSSKPKRWNDLKKNGRKGEWNRCNVFPWWQLFSWCNRLVNSRVVISGLFSWVQRVHSFIQRWRLQMSRAHLRDAREEATRAWHWDCSCACCSWLHFVCQILVRQKPCQFPNRLAYSHQSSSDWLSFIVFYPTFVVNSCFVVLWVFSSSSHAVQISLMQFNFKRKLKNDDSMYL